MKLTALTSALPIALVLVTGTATMDATAAPMPSCTFTFHTGTVYDQHDAVIAGGYAECITTPAEFSMVVTVRYKPRGGHWVTRGREPTEEIPAPRLNLATWAPCEDGLWIGVATLWETSPSGVSTQTDFESAPRIITC
ncbi:hypothetical protein [Nocardia fluminea]|uniref:hypothetical protein n=1 Tax=Nocardia fluminea TaxID=134984 RepID=UPI003657E2F5